VREFVLNGLHLALAASSLLMAFMAHGRVPSSDSGLRPVHGDPNLMRSLRYSINVTLVTYDMMEMGASHCPDDR